MQIAIITIGSRGDVQPYVALGKGLHGAGHSVRVVTHPPFEGLVRGEGLDFASLEGDPRALVEAHFRRKDASGKEQPPKGMFEAFTEAMQEMTENCWRASQDAKVLLLSTLGTLMGIPVARKRRIPALVAYVQPMMPTAEFPPLAMLPPAPAWLAALRPYYNLLAWKIVYWGFWQMCKKPAVKGTTNAECTRAISSRNDAPTEHASAVRIQSKLSPTTQGLARALPRYGLLVPRRSERLATASGAARLFGCRSPARLRRVWEHGRPRPWGDDRFGHRGAPPRSTTRDPAHRWGSYKQGASGPRLRSRFHPARLALSPHGGRGAPRRCRNNGGRTAGRQANRHYSVHCRPALLGKPGIRARGRSQTDFTPAAVGGNPR